jgi:hypothetical protein
MQTVMYIAFFLAIGYVLYKVVLWLIEVLRRKALSDAIFATLTMLTEHDKEFAEFREATVQLNGFYEFSRKQNTELDPDTLNRLLSRRTETQIVLKQKIKDFVQQ